ncbi:MAG: DNA-binding response regulator [Anaerolineae bacterium UTCFX2]|jgi:two-component system KDP operon response regulator KdpE|nr:response regulator transcription factor [Anaerolineae bacterium]MCZ7551508.1 response regulator transcription factor [Anaerolineales bacterium]OQY94559.1 MAG: DNA-binding response regulator [Anaerolineae bacterium UTCFX2]
MKDGKLNILVTDDETAIRHFLKATLSVYDHVVTEADCGLKTIELLAKKHPDLLILDLGLPDMDGVEVIREIREWSSLPIIVLSVRNREEDKIAALDAGADDYLTKPFGVGELLARIRGVMRRSFSEMMAGIYQTGNLEMDVSRRQVTINGSEIQLTPTEFDILKTLFQKPGKVFTHYQIIDKVWNSHLGDESRLLRVNISNLRHKIEPDPNRPTYIKTDLGVGYRLNDNPEDAPANSF